MDMIIRQAATFSENVKLWTELKLYRSIDEDFFYFFIIKADLDRKLVRNQSRNSRGMDGLGVTFRGSCSTVDADKVAIMFV